MCQFDLPKKSWVTDTDDNLENLAGNIEAEEMETQAEEDEAGPYHDNNEGWVDEQADML